MGDLRAERRDDWRALDAAFLRLPDLSHRLMRISTLRRDLGSPGTQVNPARVAEIVDEILQLYFGDLHAHKLGQQLALAAGDRVRAAFHRRAEAAIMQAMDRSGGGDKQQPIQSVSALQARNWAGQQHHQVMGSAYVPTDTPPTLYLMLRVRKQGDSALSELYFDLSDAYVAAAHNPVMAIGAGHPLPSRSMATLAAHGDTAAQVAYAMQLWRQNGESSPESIRWLHIASDQDNLVARELLAAIYVSLAKGRSDPKVRATLLDKAVDQLVPATNQGSADAMHQLALLYMAGHFGAENHTSGISLLQQAVELGHLDAMVALARLYHDGTLLPKQAEKARALAHAASELGHTEARLLHAWLQLNSEQGGLDEQAHDWLIDAAESDASPDAMMMLGTLHAKGDHVQRDTELAMQWFKRAAMSTRDPGIINRVVWILVVAEDKALRDPIAGLDIMSDLMNRDSEAATNPAYLDTWASAYAANGDFGTAISLQQRALSRARTDLQGETQEAVLAALAKHLKLFQSRQTVTEDVP